MKKNSIVLLIGSIAVILVIFVFVFIFLERNPDSSENINTIGITLLIVGIVTVLITTLVAAKKNGK